MYSVGPPVMVVPNVGGSRIPAPMTVYAAPPPAAQPLPLVLSEAELKQVSSCMHCEGKILHCNF